MGVYGYFKTDSYKQANKIPLLVLCDWIQLQLILLAQFVPLINLLLGLQYYSTSAFVTLIVFLTTVHTYHTGPFVVVVGNDHDFLSAF